MKKQIAIYLILLISSLTYGAIEKETQEIGVDENGKKIFMEIEKENGKILKETEVDENGKRIKVYNFTQYDKDGYPTTAEIFDAEGRYILKLQINYTDDGKIGFHMEANKPEFSEAQEIKRKIERIYYDEQYIKKRNNSLQKKSEKIKQNFEKNKISSNDETLVTMKINSGIEKKMYQDNVTAEIITDSMREYTECEIGFYNSEKINGDLKKGENSYRDIKNITGDENIYLMEMSGSEVLKLISDIAGNEKDYINFSGITIENVNGNIQNAVVNGESIDIDKIYSIALNSYICNGEGIFQYMKTKKIKYDTSVKVYEAAAKKMKIIKNIDNKYPLELRNKNIKK